MREVESIFSCEMIFCSFQINNSGIRNVYVVCKLHTYIKLPVCPSFPFLSLFHLLRPRKDLWDTAL